MIRNESRSNITKLSYGGMLIALSAVGALIKISGTIALDSMPGFFAALLLGPGAGALVGAFGHLLTALTSGFPMSLPMHLFLMFVMAFVIYVFGITYEKFGNIPAFIVGVVLNGPFAALLAVPASKVLGLPFNGWPLFSAIILPLILASIVNVFLAQVVYKSINKIKKA